MAPHSLLRVSCRLRRALSASSSVLLRHQPLLHPESVSSTSTTSPVATPVVASVAGRHFTSTTSLFRKTFDPETDEIGPDTILFEGCDYNHWLITMDFPKDNPPSREEMIETYVNTAAKIFGSVEETKKKIYALSTTTYQGFQVLCSEETSEKFKDLPGVVFVLPDSYIDPVNKEYGGDKYVDGEIFPRPPPVHYGRGPNRRRDRNYGPPPQQQNYGPPPQQQNYGPQPQQQNGPQPQQQNYRPPQQQNYGPPPHQQNYGPPPQQQNYGAPPQQQNFGAPPQQQNFGARPPQQNYGAPPQQNSYGAPPQQHNYGPRPQQPNYGAAPPQQQNQNYGAPPLQQNYNTSQPPNNGAPPQHNYGGQQQQQQQNYAPQGHQNYRKPPNFERGEAPFYHGSSDQALHGSRFGQDYEQRGFKEGGGN